MKVNQKDDERVSEIFASHMGVKEGVSRNELYQEMFGEAYSEKTLEKASLSKIRWAFLKRIMARLRKKTPFFISQKFVVGEWRFFMLRSEEESREFCDRMESIVKGIRFTQRRAETAAGATVAIRVPIQLR